MQDDAVVLDDEEAAEGLVSLQGGLENLSLKEGESTKSEEAETAADIPSQNEETGEKGESLSENKNSASGAETKTDATEEESSTIENGPRSPPGSKTDESDEGVDQQFNSNVFWKPTFEVSIDDG